MNLIKNLKKRGQALPLNTIVIAILVIIVLLVIIVFFTTEVGKTGDQLSENSASSCSISNPALATLGYTGFISKDKFDQTPGDYKKAVGVSDCYVSKTQTDTWTASAPTTN